MQKCKFLILIVSIIFLFSSGEIFGAENNSNVNFECTHSTDNLTFLHYKLNNYQQDTIMKNGKKYKKISLNDEGKMTYKGKPDLPIVSRIIAIPSDAEVSLRIKTKEF